MALKIYSDASCTEEVLSNEVFTGDGVETDFVLTLLTGLQVGNVYLESVATYTSITFASGVSSSLSGANYAVNSLVGYRVYHNDIFVGCVASNTSNTVTLDDLTYTQATAFKCDLSGYAKQTLVTHYNITGNTIEFVTAPTNAQLVHVVPYDTLNVNFGGDPADSVTTTSSVWLKRTPGYTYDTLKVYVEDLSATVFSSTTAGVTASAGVFSGFVGLTTNALVGHAIDHKGTFRGVITANNSTTVTIAENYTDAVAGDAQIYSVSQVEASLDNSNWYRVVHPAAINSDAATRVYLRDTVKIPNVAMNYPDLTIRLSGIEYLE